MNTRNARSAHAAHAPGRFIARFFLLMACIWPIGAHAGVPDITWTQTQPFSFEATAATIYRSEGGGSFAPMSSAVQSGTLDFAGALANFQVGQYSYALTSVQAALNSTYSSRFLFRSVDCCFLTDAYVAGEIQSIIQTKFSFESQETTERVQYWSGLSYNDLCTFGTCEAWLTVPIVTTVDRQWSWQDTSFFTRSGDLQLWLLKDGWMHLTGWNEDDATTEVTNSENKWAGSVTLRYIYTAQPVPEAPVLGLFVPGLLVVALVARRRLAAPR